MPNTRKGPKAAIVAEAARTLRDPESTAKEKREASEVLHYRQEILKEQQEKKGN